MKSLRLRLILGFSCCSLGAGFLTAAFIYARLGGWISDLEVSPITNSPARFATSGGLSGGLSGSLISDSARLAGASDDVQSLQRRVVIEALPLILVFSVAAAFAGSFSATRIIAPFVSLNKRLAAFNDSKSDMEIEFPQVDREFQELIVHFRGILERLTTALKDTREYAAEVAHELRTPLQVIRLKLETSQLMIDPTLSEELQEEVYRLRHVVEQVLLIAKAGRKRLTLQTSRFSISGLTDELVEDFHLLAAEEDRKLLFKSSGNYYILSDPKYFRQVLHALLSNAMTHGEGEIRLRITQRADRARLFICNRVRMSPGSNNLTLGLGLRVVKALLSIMPCTAFRRYSGATVYGVLLEFATVSPPPASPPLAIPGCQTA